MKRLFGLMSLVMLVLLAAPSSYAGPILFFADLNGPSESPPNASPAIGFAQVALDTAANTIAISASFSGLTAPTTAAHIHCCVATPGTGTAGVAVTPVNLTGFPLGVTSGTYSNVFDTTSASTYTGGFLTFAGGLANAETVLLTNLLDRRAYFNIHSTAFPSGEIRGFLATPEPGTFGLLAVGIAALGVAVRRRRS